MTTRSPLQGGARRRRFPRPLAVLVLLLALVGGAAFGITRADVHLPWQSGGGGSSADSGEAAAKAPAHPPQPPGSPYAVALEGSDVLHLRFHHPPRAGLVFDVHTGKVLWRRNPYKRLPIASLTKIMTALLVAEKTAPRDEIRVPKAALNYTGSGVGLLPKGRHVTMWALMNGLLLPSGNDAALALAIGVAGSERSFVRMMNRRARELGLRCTRYVSPHGVEDGNRSCAADLAALSRLAMSTPEIRRIVHRKQSVVRFPIKGGKLWLNSTNPLLRAGYRGTIGLKTGDTDAAGHCFIGIVRRGGRELGVVLLHSPNTLDQSEKLLDRAFRSRL